MTHHHDESLLATTLASLKTMIQRALEERDEEEAAPIHSAAVVDRAAGFSEKQRLG